MKVLKSLTVSALATSALLAQTNLCIDDTQNGWHLKGATSDIYATELQNNSNIEAVWIYNAQSNPTNPWKLYTKDGSTGSFSNFTEVSQGQGFWVKCNYNETNDNNTTNPTGNSPAYVYNIPIEPGAYNDTDTHQIYVSTQEAVNMDFQNYIKDEDGDSVTVTTQNTSGFPAGLSINSDGITGTASNVGDTTTFNLELNDGTNTSYSNLRITVIDKPSDDEPSFTYGDTINMLSFDMIDAGPFFEVEGDEDTFSYGKINIDNSNVTYQEYVFDENSSNFSATQESETISYYEKGTTSLKLDFTGEPDEKILFKTIESVQTIDGVSAPLGLHEATVEFEILEDITDYSSIEDWWPTYYTIDGNSISSLSSLKSFLVDKQYGTVWVNKDTQVYLQENGKVQSASWDGTYGSCNDCDNGYYERYIPTGDIITDASWSLDNNYLSVTVPNIGTVVFRQSSDEAGNSYVEKTEIPVKGSVETLKWYYGISQSEFETTLKNNTSQ